MTRIKPFGKDHVIFADPLEAVQYYEAHAEREDRKMPAPILTFLEDVAHFDPDARFAVQTGYMSNFITVARPDDRRPWLFVRPDHVSVWAGTEKNSVALCEFWDELREEDSPTGRHLPFVHTSPEKANEGGAMCAVMFAAIHAEKETVG